MDKESDKLWRKMAKDQQKRIKPGECQKYVRLVIDPSLLSAPYGPELLSELNSGPGELKYEIRKLATNHCVLWERNRGQQAFEVSERSGSALLSEMWEVERRVVRILTSDDLQHYFESASLARIAEELRTNFPHKQHIVLVVRPKERKQANQLATALIEMQVRQQLNVLQVPPGAPELVAQLKRLTKSIAEEPYKLQKSKALGGFRRFLANDKKQCVRVEGTNGFGRLWQQHLNRLPLVTLEVAESIIEKYSCPKQLFSDFRNNTNAVRDLADLKIRRSGPQALQTDRRVGGVLSSKLHALYTATDGSTLI